MKKETPFLSKSGLLLTTQRRKKRYLIVVIASLMKTYDATKKRWVKSTQCFQCITSNPVQRQNWPTKSFKGASNLEFQLSRREIYRKKICHMVSLTNKASKITDHVFATPYFLLLSKTTNNFTQEVQSDRERISNLQGNFCSCITAKTFEEEQQNYLLLLICHQSSSERTPPF